MEQAPNSSQRVSKLEKRVKNIEAFLEDRYESFEAVHTEASSKVMASTTDKSHKTAPSTGPTPLDEFFNWLKEDWLMKLGAFLLLLALGWFVTYAFVNNWIGETGRIALGILVGAGVMIAGNFMMPKKRAAGQVLVVLGGVMVLLTIFAARFAYDFFTPTTALLMMSIVVVGMATIAVVHNAKSVAILALLGGAIVPLLVKSPDPNFLALLSYIFVLNLGTIFVAALRGWREMSVLAIIITGLYSLVTFGSLERAEGTHVVWIFMALYFGLFFISNLAAIIKTKMAGIGDLFVTAINGLLLLFWIYEFVPRESASLVLSGIILLLVGISYVLAQIKNLNSMLYLHSALAVLFLGAATAFELDGQVLVVAFAIEALVIVVLAAYALRDSRLAHIASTTQTISVLMALPSIVSRSWQTENLFNQDFFVLLFVILSLASTTAVLKNIEDEKDEAGITMIHGAVAAILAIALVWLTTHNIFDSVNLARGAALVIYSLAGVITLFYGTYLENKPQRVIGGLLLAGVVVRLLFVEVWTMSLAGKIITFVAIGVLLVSTAFFQKRISHPDQ